jgi:diadenosine tetraphosphate (Ap4A) HIT family hydrolase
MAGYVLDPRLAEGSAPIAAWPLCELRLKDDARFAWLLLVPRRAGIVELTDLARSDYHSLTSEILAAVRLVRAVAAPDKTNVATIGNLVAQLHVHVVGRSRGDPAWPGTVWAAGPGPAYDPAALAGLARRYREAAAAALAGAP